ncbi:hypothetical protein OG989_04045 [Micromonospora sp. NBC_01740]|uniref:hypothetical protein n=1 Tax=Micromonospora sp. NBC_01740 TaxID=2975986 RepID=UPI002E11A58C|nr:hypothetical protein OG989_04045 [Micromonospora sp. NBC_01740]
MAWYLNRALTGFRAAVNAAYPNRDKASDGTIGDAAHKAGTSDHNEDPDGSVDAWDMDVDLRSDNDAAAIERLKKVFQAHPAARYWIHDGQIAHRSTGWRRERYTGSNRHDKHVHWNSNEATEDSTVPWVIEGDDMTRDEVKAAAREALLEVLTTPLALPGRVGERMTAAGWAPKMEPWTALARLVEALVLGKPPVADVDETQLAAELGKLLPANTAVTDEQLERVLRRVLGSLDAAQPAS